MIDTKIFIARISALFLTILLFISSVHAYDIEWIGLQTREFSSGYVFNRAYFSVIPIDTAINLENISLTDPNNESIPYAGTEFKPWRRLEYYELAGDYNSNTGLFDYGPVTQHLYFSMDFDINPPTPKPLIEGTYTFDIDGDVQTADVYTVVDLPFIDSETLRKSYGFNSNYNENVTTLYWSIPDLSGLNPNNVQFRVSADFYNETNYVGGLYIYVPPNLNYVIIPDSVINNADLPEYTKFSVGVQVEDIPYQHRTYSNSLNMEEIRHRTVPLSGVNLLLLSE